MKFIKKRTKDDIGFDDEEFYDGDYYNMGNAKDNAASFGDETEPEEDVRRAAPIPGVAFGGGSSAVALKVIKPKGYDDGPEIADYLAGGSTVLLNIENLDKNSTKRLLDFLLGATHVLGGSTKMVARGTFVFAPRSVGVSDVGGDDAEPENGDAEADGEQ